MSTARRPTIANRQQVSLARVHPGPVPSSPTTCESDPADCFCPSLEFKARERELQIDLIWSSGRRLLRHIFKWLSEGFKRVLKLRHLSRPEPARLGLAAFSIIARPSWSRALVRQVPVYQ